MVLDSGEVFMDQVEGESVGSSRGLLEPDVGADPPKTVAMPRTPVKRRNVAKKEKVSHNGLPAQTNSSQVVQRRPSSSVSKGGATPRPPLRRPLSLEMTPQRLRGSQEQMVDRRIVQPPWRSGSAAPSPPARSLTSPSLGAGGWMRRSESTCSVNYSLGLRAGRGQMRPATSLPHIAKGGVGSRSLPTPTRPCLLVALRPLNLEQEKQTFFQSDYKYEPQFEYAQPEPRSVLEKYREGSGLFLEQVQYQTSTSHLRVYRMMMMMMMSCLFNCRRLESWSAS